jgi:hypothetical protein
MNVLKRRGGCHLVFTLARVTLMTRFSYIPDGGFQV